MQLASNLLRVSARAYAKGALFALEEAQPEIVTSRLPDTFASPADDIEVRLLQLAASVAMQRPALLADAFAWYKVALHHRGVPAEYLPATIAAIETTLSQELPNDAFACVRDHLAAATVGLGDAPVDLPTHLSKDALHGELAMRFLLANLEGRGDDALDLVRGAVHGGVPVEELHEHVLVPVQRETGRMWAMGDIPIADEHYGSAIVERAIGVLQEYVARAPADAPRVLLLGVGGNLHGIGLRVVAQRLQQSGFHVHNLGANMPATDIDWAVRDVPADLVAISAAMLLHLPALTEMVAAVRAAMAQVYGDEGARPVLVGGAPFALVGDLHKVVGADASAVDGDSAVAAAQRLVSGR